VKLTAANTAIVLDPTAAVPDAADHGVLTRSSSLAVTLGAVIGAHAGPGTLALWFRDDA
jgi:tagatose-1,6-bisphosphate aldolase